jgi:hypothetical protein
MRQGCEESVWLGLLPASLSALSVLRGPQSRLGRLLEAESVHLALESARAKNAQEREQRKQARTRRPALLVGGAG